MSTLKNLNRREFLHQFGFGTMSIGLLAGMQQCTPPTDEVGKESSFTFMCNAKDPLILKAKTSEGGMIEYFGTRNAAGLPTAVNLVGYRADANQEDASYFHFDSKSNLTKILIEDGSQMLFNWTTATKAIMTFVSADKTQQQDTEIDFSANPKRIAAQPLVAASGLEARNGKSIVLSDVLDATQESNAQPAFRISAQSLDVEVSKCGFPADADVIIFMYKYDKLNNLVKIGEFPAVKTKKGSYSCMIIPQDAGDNLIVNTQEMCNWAIQKGVCKVGAEVVARGLCAGLTVTAGLASGGIAAALAAVACNKFVTPALKKIVAMGCGKLFDESAAAHSAEEFCSASFENRNYTLWTGKLLFIAKAVGATPKPVYSKGVEIEGGTSLPKLSVDLGGSASVNQLTLQPSAPTANQAYTAKASINCVSYGTVVKLNVVGTDGYNDTATSTVSVLSGDGTFSIQLLVPGAKTAGIADVVTLTADLPDGRKLKQTASLVFG